MEKGEGAKIVSLESLMNEKIGSPEEDRVKSDKELEEALNKDKKKDTDYFDLDDKDLEKDPTPKTEDSDNKETAEEVVSKNGSDLEDNKKVVGDTDEERQSDIYKKIIRSMFGDDLTHVIQQDADGNDVEVAIEDITLTEKYFNEIVQAKIEMDKERELENKVSLEGVSDFTKRLIEIDRKGGDISELIAVKEAYSDPLDKIDLSTEEGQMEVVFLAMAASGHDQDKINRLIASYKSDGTLEQEAEMAYNQLRAAIDKQLELAEQAVEQQKQKEKQLLKDYRKEFKEGLDKFELKDTIKAKIVNMATKRDEDGRFELDSLYRSVRQDPKQAALLAVFLMDREEYDKQISNGKLQEEKLKSARTVVRVSGKSVPSVASEKEKTTRPTPGGNLISLDSLND